VICALIGGRRLRAAAYVRTMKTASGATAVQIVWSSRRGSRRIEHVGSAHNEAALAALKAVAAQRLAHGQAELDLGLGMVADSGSLPIMSAQMSHLWDALCAAYAVLGFESVTQGDKVFRDLVLARIIEPTSRRLTVAYDAMSTPTSASTRRASALGRSVFWETMNPWEHRAPRTPWPSTSTATPRKPGSRSREVALEPGPEIQARDLVTLLMHHVT
jgi:hypothetical protein